MSNILYIVVPCYNEQEVLPITAPLFLQKINDLAAAGKISPDSRVLFVNDGSRDRTWEIINELAASDEHYVGICQSRDRGHQNAVLAGLMEAKDRCDITISIDCDGQDDINAMDGMVDAYRDGCDVVYGVRSKRDTDTFFKRFTAESFYKLLNAMGAEVVYNHADYRLMSARVLQEFAKFKEVRVDGVVIDVKNYTVTEGSTIITLKTEYLKTLPAGKHTFEIAWTDGSAATYFTVAGSTTEEDNKLEDNKVEDNTIDDKKAEDNNVENSRSDVDSNASLKTGDTTDIRLWLILLMSALTIMTGLTVKSKRNDCE